MRFTVALLLIGAVAANYGGEHHKESPEISESIVYKYEEHTVTKCAPEVTDCPEAVKVHTSTIAETTTYCPEEDVKPTKIAELPPRSVSKCEHEAETCTVTVTKPKSWGTGGPWVPSANVTAPVAVGTGTPIKPAPSYYSNAASSLKGGAIAIAGGALALLAL